MSHFHFFQHYHKLYILCAWPS